MKCPKCETELSLYNREGLKISYCKKCKTMWIKFPALQKIGEMLDLKIPLINPVEMESIKVKEEPRNCPECAKSMDKVYFNGMVVDKCSDCNGILFDNGELSKYFNLFMKNPVGVVDNLAFLENYCNKSRVERQEFVSKELEIQSKEKERRVISINGFAMLFVMLLGAGFAWLFFLLQLFPLGMISVILLACLLPGFKLLKPQEAMVLTVFGKYIGTLRGAGFHYVNPFAQSATFFVPISLKAMTLDNGKQKINDELGNPIEVGIIVIWEVQDTAKALFNVDDYKSFLSAQCDSALRNIVRMYPYDSPEDSGVQSLRGDSQEISAKLKAEIQRNVKVAGLNIVDAKISHLAYSPEIAVAMLQRQQAAAVVDAKKAIVDGAVGMVEMALNKLSSNNIVQLDENQKAKMVNDLLVILCSNKEALKTL
uniref:SPFH domain-containing protein n=1 Tax=Candidatus Scatousia sp. TaxID=3085663 RepID=UPI00402813FC